MRQDWYRSWALWTAIAALVILLVKMIFKVDLGKYWDEMAELVLTILVGFGVVNNPNTSDRWVLPNIGKQPDVVIEDADHE
jgi:uncharacterized membrane protein